MSSKFSGRIIKIFSYGFTIKTLSGEIGTLKNESILDDDLRSSLKLDSHIVVYDNGRRSVKGGILWDLNPADNKTQTKLNSEANNKFIDNISSDNFLSPLFKGKSREQSIELVNTLVGSIESIDADEIYKIALNLIEINRSFKPILNKTLNTILFFKANRGFKYRMWIDKLIKYCDFGEVLNKYEEGADSIVNFLNSEYNFDARFSKDIAPPQCYTSGIQDLLLAQIKNAHKSIKIAVAWFTNPKLLNALAGSVKKGVEVILVTNNDLINNGGYCLRLDDLIEAGGSIHLAEYPETLNHKFAIFDNSCVITGSYNWTISAEHFNRENVIRVEGEGMDSTIAGYLSIFEKMIEDFEKVQRMPETVPEKPQYDRYSFKQYITEETIFLAKRTQNPEKRKYFYQRAAILTPNHPQIPDEYKTSEAAQNVSRRNSVIKEEQRLRHQEESISAQLEVTSSQIAELKAQVQAFDASNPQSEDAVELKNRIDKLTQDVTNGEQQIVILQQEQELLQNVSKSNLVGSNGKFRVHLEWRTIDDLDLHLIIPDGQEIYYSNKNITSNGCTGHLDVDANAGSNYTSSPQENIFWDDTAPEGRYKINIHCFTYRSGCSSIPFVVTVFSEGSDPITKTGLYNTSEAQAKQTKTILEFDFSRENGIKIL